MIDLISGFEKETNSLIGIFELKLWQEKKTNFVKDFSMLKQDASWILNQNLKLMSEKAENLNINLLPTSTTLDFVEMNSHLTNVDYKKIECWIEGIET